MDESNEFYYDLVAMCLVRQNSFKSPNALIFEPLLLKTDADFTGKIAERICYYSQYFDFLDSILKFKNLLMLGVLKQLSDIPSPKESGKTARFITHFADLLSESGVDVESLLKKIDACDEFFAEEINIENISEINLPVFLEKTSDYSCRLRVHCVDVAMTHLGSLSQEEWYNSFKEPDSFAFRTSVLLPDFEYSTPAHEALKVLLNDIANSSIPIPDRLVFETVIEKLQTQGISLKSTFNTVRDILCRNVGVSVELFKFFASWLFEYADLAENKNSLRAIFTSEVVNDDACLDIIYQYIEKMPSIIKAANEEATDFFAIVRQKLNNSPSSKFNEFATSLNITSESD